MLPLCKVDRWFQPAYDPLVTFNEIFVVSILQRLLMWNNLFFGVICSFGLL